MRKNHLLALSARHKRGFTFIEVIIVISILSIISLVIYTSFSKGINIWQMVNEKSPEEDMNILLDKFSFDLRNTFKFTGINFSGHEDGIEFPVLLNSPRFHKKSVGKVVYSYDSNTNLLNKEEVDFNQIYEDKKGLIKHSLKNVKSFKFQYYTYDKGRKEYLWQDEWAKEGLPLAVRIYLEIKDGDRINGFIRTVGVPTGG